MARFSETVRAERAFQIASRRKLEKYRSYLIALRYVFIWEGLIKAFYYEILLHMVNDGSHALLCN
jgi:hypothetical protein